MKNEKKMLKEKERKEQIYMSLILQRNYVCISVCVCVCLCVFDNGDIGKEKKQKWTEKYKTKINDK